MTARIFISHSCKHPWPDAAQSPAGSEDALREEVLAYARKVRGLVCRRLAAKFEVWLDETGLQPGVDWRRDMGANVKIVPALLGDLRPGDLERTPLAPLELSISQTARIDSTVRTDAAAEELAEKIAMAFAGQARCEPVTDLERWLKRVRKVLGQVERPYLEDTAEVLGIRRDEWVAAGDADGDLAATVAHELLHTSLDRARRALEELKEGMSTERLRTLYQLVRPVWVDVGAARSLEVALSASRVAVLSGQYVDTAEDYIRRARCCEVRPERIIQGTLPTGMAPLREGSEQFLAALCVDKNLSLSKDRAIIEAFIADESVQRFVVLGPGPLHPALVSGLSAAYERLRFVVLGRRETVDAFAAAVGGDVVRPCLAPGVEARMRASLLGLEEIL